MLVPTQSRGLVAPNSPGFGWGDPQATENYDQLPAHQLSQKAGLPMQWSCYGAAKAPAMEASSTSSDQALQMLMQTAAILWGELPAQICCIGISYLYIL